MVSMRTDISKSFRSVRKALGLTQAEMARAIGVCRVTLCMYETGAIRAPGGDKVLRLLQLAAEQMAGQIPQEMVDKK